MTTADMLATLGRKHKRLREELDDLRPQLAEAIRNAAGSGMRQVEIVKATGYTREMVRRIVGADQ